MSVNNDIFESIPNFSTSEPVFMAKTAELAASYAGVKLLDLSASPSAGRTVVTVAGYEEPLLDFLCSLLREAGKCIDMAAQHGVHPRLGACDVLPLVPLNMTDMAKAVALAEKLAARLAAELNIPIYLYERSARADFRRSLEQIRRGQYESLPRKLQDPLWLPDYGPAEFQPAWGATVLGARPPLIAYNVNLQTAEVAVAKKIAGIVRESGCGSRRPGRLKAVKAIGWYIEEYQMSQVSMNLTDYTVTGLKEAFLAVREEAARLGVRVCGSEVIGLLPRAAYQPSWIGELGLSAVSSFDPRKKIIENVLDF